MDAKDAKRTHTGNKVKSKETKKKNQKSEMEKSDTENVEVNKLAKIMEDHRNQQKEMETDTTKMSKRQKHKVSRFQNDISDVVDTKLCLTLLLTIEHEF